MRILTYIEGSPGKGVLYKNMGMCRLKLFLILSMQRIKEIESLLMTTAFMLEAIWLPEEVKSRVLYLVLLKQSME